MAGDIQQQLPQLKRKGKFKMKLKYIATLATASILSLGVVTACSNPCAGQSTDGTNNGATTETNPCAAKENPCAAKENPCAAKENPCAAKDN